MTETIRYGLIGKEDLKLEPRTGRFETILPDGRAVVLNALDIAYLIADSALAASFPPAQIAGRLMRRTNGQRGLWMDTASYWFSLQQQVCNIQEFGADPSGAADSTAAIQAAHDALPTTGGIIFAPPGTYKLNSVVTLNSGTKRGLQLVGSGSGTLFQPAAGITAFKLTGDAGGHEGARFANFMLQHASGSAANVGLLIDNAATGQPNWRVEGLILLGRGTATGEGISCVYAQRGVIRDSVIQSWGTGVKIASSGANVSDALVLAGLFLRSCGTGLDIVVTGAAVQACLFETNTTDVASVPTNILELAGCRLIASGAGTLTGITATTGTVVTHGCTFTGHTSVRDLVLSGSASWRGFGDSLSAGVTNTGTGDISTFGVAV